VIKAEFSASLLQSSLQCHMILQKSCWYADLFNYNQLNHHIRMISEGSCDTEGWSGNSALITDW